MTEIVEPVAAPLEPQVGHVYYDADKKPWACVQLWHHPEHRAYHIAWTGDYAILQDYGNYSNPLQLVKIEDFMWKFTLAWEPLRQCEFCGFSRMSPCTKDTFARGSSCPSLSRGEVARLRARFSNETDATPRSASADAPAKPADGAT